MLTLDYNDELNEEDDEERTVYGHAVDDSRSESNIKRSHAATRHLQEYMDRIHHSKHKRENLKHDDMTNDFWGAVWYLYR